MKQSGTAKNTPERTQAAKAQAEAKRAKLAKALKANLKRRKAGAKQG